jgi:hypothetical protein
MTEFIENSFSLNNNISISNRIKTIPLFFIHFNPIVHFKNLDKNYKLLHLSKSNLIQREIKYKIIHHYTKNDFNLFLFSGDNFSKSLYHLFYSAYILHQNKISYTLNPHSFISNDNNLNNLPCLMDFSSSFYFPCIHLNHLNHFKLYFPVSLLKNKYIPLDVFIIVYLIENPMVHFNEEISNCIIYDYVSTREIIDKKQLSIILSYFYNYNSIQIIKYLFQFKYTWTYYSLCYFFICNYSELLNHFSLYPLFHIYIYSSFKERNSNLILDIHNKLFQID